jgi:putative ABC transport system substrate-binding protein
VRRVGWLIGGAENEAYKAALLEALAKLGWIEGRNLKIDSRVGVGDANLIRNFASELVALAPDVILTSQTVATRAVQRQTQTIPIVFTTGGDAVANEVVKNIARPEGNTTGFSSLELSLPGKWLELLKAAAPRVGRVALIYNPELLAGVGPLYISSIESAAATLGVQTVKTPFRDAVELVHSVDAFAAEPNGGLIMLPPPNIGDRATILKLAVHHRMPAIYSQRSLVAEGGLMSYGTDAVDQYRRAASYVDRILRGGKVSDLPVQFPTKFELVVNLKTAKAIGLTIPETFLLHADALIE